MADDFKFPMDKDAKRKQKLLELKQQASMRQISPEQYDAEAKKLSTPLQFMQSSEQEKQTKLDKEMAERGGKEAAVMGTSAITGAGGLADAEFDQYELKSSQLLPEDQEFFRKHLAGLRQRALDARQEYQENKNRTEWLSLAETLGHALTQLGAARQGLRSGVDMSGLKFNKNDWNNNYNRLLKELDSNLDEIRGERGEVSRYREALERQTVSAEREKARLAEKGAAEKAKVQKETEKKSAADTKKEVQYNQVQRLISELGDVDEDSKEYKNAMKQLINFGISESEANSLLSMKDKGLWGTGYWADRDIPAIKQALEQKFKGPSNTVKVIFNGQQLEIQKEDLPQALKDGAKVIE